MAIVQNPHIGRSSGKFSTGVFATVLGKNVLRSKALSVSNPRTLPQQKVRAKLATLSSFAKMFALAVNVGFKDDAVAMYPRNYFVKTNYGTLSISDLLVPTIHWDLFSLSKGGLCTIANPVADIDGTDIDFTWELYADVIDPDWEMAIVITKGNVKDTRIVMTAAKADDLAVTLAKGDFIAGDKVYMFAYDPTTLVSSDSVYTAIIA